MKKMAVFMVVLALLVMGCDSFNEKTKVTNDSDYDVTFTFNHFKEKPYTLKSHTSDYYDEYPYYSIKSYYATPPRVSYFTYNEETRFFNTSARQIKIVNEIDKDVSITALGCMDNEPIIVPANSELIVAIYTLKPEFSGVTVPNSFPINFTYSTNNSTVMAHW